VRLLHGLGHLRQGHGLAVDLADAVHLGLAVGVVDDRRLGIGKVVTGTQPVVLIGMSGTSQIVTAKAENALVVPSNALIVDPQTKGYSVQVVGPNGTPQQVPVKIGFRGSTQVQILSGVSAGDVLVIPSATTTTGTGGAGGGPGGGGPGPGGFGD
jgi:hypothetical protein